MAKYDYITYKVKEHYFSIESRLMELPDNFLLSAKVKVEKKGKKLEDMFITWNPSPIDDGGNFYNALSDYFDDLTFEEGMDYRMTISEHYAGLIKLGKIKITELEE